MASYFTKKKQLSHAVEYGLIFHGTRIGKYYCKNMKYSINIYTKISMRVQQCVRCVRFARSQLYISRDSVDMRK